MLVIGVLVQFHFGLQQAYRRRMLPRQALKVAAQHGLDRLAARQRLGNIRREQVRQPALAQPNPTAPPAHSQPIPPVPTPVAPPADTTPSRPVLSVALDTAGNVVAVGDTTTISITVTNRGVVPAPATRLSLPIPDGVQIVAAGDGTPNAQGLTWDLGTLDAASSTTHAITVRALGVLKGDAAVLQPQASAPDAVAAATTTGGFLVVQRGLGAANATFTPGSAVTLTSRDGRVSLQVPPGLFRRALTLRHRALIDARDDLIQQGKRLPPRFVGAHRSVQPFVLDATDAGGADIHQFDVPLTLTVHYTPEQLQALGIREQDLQLYWFDETARIWQALPTTVDEVAHTASAPLTHFTTLTLSDGSSPSAAYLPSLQGWQVSNFTGAASYRYPIALPSGPAGLAPQIALSYSSAASDGSGGTRPLTQAGWVGKGWSLDGLGYIATNENRGQSDHAWDSYSMVFGEQSFDLVKGKRVDGQVNQVAYNDTALDHWNWHASDENFTRVIALNNSGQFSWRAWTPDGTRYDFDQQLRWGENTPTTTYWTYKWLLTRIVDPRGNAIVFDYVIDTITNSEVIHPTYYLHVIRWGFDGATPGTGTARYRVVFDAANRQTGTTAGVDPNWEFSTARVNGQSGTPHEIYRLDDITVQSWPSGATDYQTIRNYHLTYASAATSVQTDVTAGQKNLTLLNIEQRDQNYQTINSPGAPSPTPFKTSFTYGMTQGDPVTPNPGWNRLLTIDNGRGGKLTFTYGHVWQQGATPNNSDSYTAYYQNYYRVTQAKAEDLAGASQPALTTYDYGAAGNATVNDDAHAATVLYARYAPGGLGDSTAYLMHAVRREFRGHATVIERVYDGGTTAAPLLRTNQRWFYQGNSSAAGDPAATCAPPLVSGAVDTTSACFQWMKKYEGLRGRAYREDAGTGATALTRTTHTFARIDMPFYGSDAADASFSNHYQRAGLWRAFSYETQTDAQTLGAATLVHTIKSFYNLNCVADDLTSVTASYGNIGCTQEYDGSTLVRTTKRWFGANTGTGYIVDRQWQEAIYNGAGNIVALTNQFYDGASAADTAPASGKLTRVSRYFDVPGNAPGTTGLTLHGSDTAYGYDAYGNPTTQTTYTGASTRTYNGTTFTWGALNGTARTTTTQYDSVFHMYPTQVTNPLSQSTRGDYDYRMGTLIRVTGPNTTGTPTNCAAASYTIPATEETTCAQYDTFGRMVRLVKPGDSSASPTMQAFYYDTERPFRYLVERPSGGIPGDAWSDMVQFYDGLGQKVQIKRESQPGGAQMIVTDMRYDGLGRLAAQSQPRATTSTWSAYIAPGATLANPTTTSYDGLGRPLTITAPDTSGTRTTTHSYGVETGTIRSYDSVTDPLSHTTRTRSDALGRRTQVIEEYGLAGASTTTYAYNALDVLVSVTDALGNLTSMQYDSLGRKTSMTDPDMGTWQYSYNPTGTLASQTDAKSQATTFGYDNLDRLTGKTMAAGWASYYAYDDTTAPNKGIGHRTGMWTYLNGVNKTYKRWEYDARGRTTLVGQSPAGVTTDLGYGYNNADQLVTMAYYETGETVTYTYDIAGRPATLCSNLGGCYVSSATYTALDQPDLWTYGNSVPQDWAYEPTTGRLSVLQVGATTGPAPNGLFKRTYTYDAADNVTAITAPQWPQTQHFSYDTRDRLTHAWTTATLASAPARGPVLAQATAPEQARTPDLGAAIERRDAPTGSDKPLLRPAAGVAAQSTLIKALTFEGGSLTDPATGADSVVGTVTLEIGAPIKGSYAATVPNVSSGYLNESFTGVADFYASLYIRPASFPASARIVQIRTGTTTVGEIRLTTSGTLELRNAGTTIGTSSALSANTVYRVGIHQKAGAAGAAVLEAFVVVGDAAFGAAFASSTGAIAGNASEIRIGATNNAAVNATIDDIMLDSAVMPGPSGGGGTPTTTPTITPIPPTPTSTPVGPTATSVGGSAPPAYDMTMTYDALGNLLSKTGVGAYAYGATGAGTGTGPHQARTVNGASYSYDLNGNLLSGGGRTYTWTPENLPATITTSSGTESYTYDADGERVVRVAGGVTTAYFEGLWEQTTAGAWKTYYRFNGQVVALRDSATNAVTYLHGDHLGSVSVTTNASGTANVQEYDPWGSVRSGSISATTLNYTGQRLDGTGLLDYHARMYDPVLARFVSADSVVPGSASGSMDGVQLRPLTVDFHEPGFVGTLNRESAQPFWFQLSDDAKQQVGEPWGPQEAQALNRYSYVQNNSVRWTDPTGHLGATLHGNGTVTFHLSHEDIQTIAKIVGSDGMGAISNGATVLGLLDKIPKSVGIVGLVSAIIWYGAKALEYADWLLGNKGLDITIGSDGLVHSAGAPTVERQHGVYKDSTLKWMENAAKSDPELDKHGQLRDYHECDQPATKC